MNEDENDESVDLGDIHRQLVRMNGYLQELVDMTQQASAVFNSPIGRMAARANKIRIQK